MHTSVCKNIITTRINILQIYAYTTWLMALAISNIFPDFLRPRKRKWIKGLTWVRRGSSTLGDLSHCIAKQPQATIVGLYISAIQYTVYRLIHQLNMILLLQCQVFSPRLIFFFSFSFFFFLPYFFFFFLSLSCSNYFFFIQVFSDS